MAEVDTGFIASVVADQIDSANANLELEISEAVESAVQAALNDDPMPFPMIQQMEIIECGHAHGCEVECPLIYEWSPPTSSSSVNDCDRPTWVRYEIVADWINQVDSCRFVYSYKAPSSQYGTPSSFGIQGISADGIGTDSLRFTFYAGSNPSSMWVITSDWQESIPGALTSESVSVMSLSTSSNGNKHHVELSVLMNGVWYNTNIMPYR